MPTPEPQRSPERRIKSYSERYRNRLLCQPASTDGESGILLPTGHGGDRRTGRVRGSASSARISPLDLS